MSSLFQLTESDHDQLRELVNIGVAHAGNTMSRMMGKRITISIPMVKISNAESTLRFTDKEDDVTVAVLLRLTGTIEGYVFMFFPRDAALLLLEDLSGKKDRDLRTLDRFDESIFQELGNVVTGGMLSGLSKFLHIEMLHSVPNVVIDMGGAMFDSISASMIDIHEEFLSLDVSICIDANSSEVMCERGQLYVGRMFLFLGPEATSKILKITNAMVSNVGK